MTNKPHPSTTETTYCYCRECEAYWREQMAETQLEKREDTGDN